MKISSQKFYQIFILVVILLFISAFAEAESEKIVKTELEQKELISINLKEVELETALIMLANTAEKNLICDSSIAGKLTVIFNEIYFEDALNLITDSFNLDYSYQDNIIYVSTAEKIAAKKDHFVSKNYQFKHLSSEKVIEILAENFEELKLVNLKSSGVLINCKKADLNRVEKILSQIDHPQKQIMINARVEEISRTKIKELGINPDQLSKLKIIKDEAGNLDKLKPSWPDTLKALNEKGLSNILANPSLMTLDRKKAKLIIGDQIPVKLERVEDDKTVSTLNYIEAGIVLEFLPKILNEDQLILEIKPSVNSLGQILADGLPAVNSRSAETTVVLKNGETLAIGGLIKKDELKSIKELPILADLPILGSIFSSNQSQDIETELIIFITPKIIENDYGLKVKNNEQLELKKLKSNNKLGLKNKLEKKRADFINQKEKRVFKGLTKKELKEILAK